MYVGFKGHGWSGGRFESAAATPEEAADEVLRGHQEELPGEMTMAIVTDWPKFALTLERGGDGSGSPPEAP